MLEIVFWVATLAPFVLTPNYLVLCSQIAIAALFALSLDLLVGYSGLVSLGHAVFFGFGAYSAGLLAKLWMGGADIGLGLREPRRRFGRLSDQFHHGAHQPLCAHHGDAWPVSSRF